MKFLCKIIGHRRWIFRRARPEADRLSYLECPRCGVTL